jgi:hypothetical protein
LETAAKARARDQTTLAIIYFGLLLLVVVLVFVRGGGGWGECPNSFDGGSK